MKQIKVLLVANVAKGHVNKFHIPTIKYLKSKGWHIDVACSLDEDIPFADNVYDMSWKRSPFTFKTLKGIVELYRLLKKNQYDIIYSHTPVGGLVARFASIPFRKHGLKVVYFAHGLHFFKGASILSWLLFYPMEKLMAEFTDMFITINDEDYERVKKKFNRHMLVRKTNGIGANFNRLDIKSPEKIRQEYRNKLHIPIRSKVLIYVAEINNNKNQQMLIKTLKNLRSKNLDVYLLLVGPDYLNGRCQQLSAKLQVQEYTKFLGWRNDIGELLSASDIYVASSKREGLAINLVEAQYAHLPVVATSNRGHLAVIRNNENGILVPIDDYSSMADQITILMENPDLYKKMANVDVSKYESVTVASEIHECLSDVLKYRK